MSQHHERGLLLFNQSRYELAEREFRQCLAENPDFAPSHAFLALCLSEKEQFKEASAEARRAIALTPDSPFVHYVLGRVAYDSDRYEEAEQALLEALRLDPDDADCFCLLAAVYHDQRRWAETLSTAEEGLASDPEHPGCTNLRAMALVKLGRRDEASTAIASALERDPENAVTHANQGWTLLHAGKAKQAMEHFREALRLEPDLEWARAGILEAMKARNPIYALLLRYFLWMASLSGKWQWGIIVGGYVGYRVLDRVAAKNPQLAPFVWPVLIAYIGFVFLTWVAVPLFNLLLRLDRFGRLTLSREQIVASNWVGGSLLAALGVLTAWLFTGEEALLRLGLVLGMLVLPLSASFNCPDGWPTWVMRGVTALLAVAGGGAAWLTFQRSPDGGSVFGAFCVGILVSTFVANGLAMVRPSR